MSTLPTKPRVRPRGAIRDQASTGRRTRCVRWASLPRAPWDQARLSELLLQREGDTRTGPWAFHVASSVETHAGSWPLRCRVEQKVNYANVKQLQARVLRYGEKME